MSKSLPRRPDFDQLRKLAKDLLKSYRAGETPAIERVRAHHPKGRLISRPDVSLTEFRLGDAQLVIAREYGFTTWSALKTHVLTTTIETADPVELFKMAVGNDDAQLLRRLLERHPLLKAKINAPIAGFDSPVITCARSREILDVLIEAGADLNAKSNWWAGGFGLLHTADPNLAAYAIQRGAIVDIHAASRLGLVDRLRELLRTDPALVHARGGDGQTPLHFARSIEIAELLLRHGAAIDARDVDHESTPAQYMVHDRQDVARYLVQRGCQTDILMAAALGDVILVRDHLERDPGCIRMRVSEEFFPMIGGRAGGTIYQWTLGWHVSAHQVAKHFGHEAVFDLLMERSPAEVKLLNACWMGDHALLRSIMEQHSEMAIQLSEADRRQFAHAARNNNLEAVRLMLTAGFPVDVRGQHGATPLHWAAWHGNVDMTGAILQNNPPLETTDADFQGTPLRWAIHGSENGWHRHSGDYAATAELLIRAGAKLPERSGGSEAVQQVLHRHGVP